jgi:23S rRNA G2445 N2-methylase RlmL
MAGILQQELIALGCTQVEPSGSSAVHFGVTDFSVALRVLLWTRTAHKVMELLTSTSDPVYTRQDIYQFVRRTVPVQDLLGSSSSNGDSAPSQPWLTLSVAVTLNNARFIPTDINHSHYTALNVKNALVDAARDSCPLDSRPTVDTIDPDVPLVVVLRGLPPPAMSTARSDYSPLRSSSSSWNNERFRHEASTRASFDAPATTQGEQYSPSGGAHLSLYRCLHAGSLHRRGYRYDTAMHKAALKESTAAGLLLSAGWAGASQQQANAILVDPMMGSGTFLVEGAMMAADLAPGLMRIKCQVPSSHRPPIVRWKHETDNADSVVAQWNHLLKEATTRAQAGLARLAKDNVRIIGNDMHGGACDLAESALSQAGLSKVVQIHHHNCSDWTPFQGQLEATSDTPWTVVSNPPWGVRLEDDVSSSWEALRVFLRQRCPADSQAWILSGSPTATKHLGLRRSQSLPLQTGDQDLRWLQYLIRPKNNATVVMGDSEEDRDGPKRLHRALSSINQGEATQPLQTTRERPTRSKVRKVIEKNEWLI